MTKKLTVEQAIAIARRARACLDVLDTLTSLGTWDTILAQPHARDWLDWFAAYLPAPLLPAFEEYKRVKAAAYKEYKRARAAAWEGFDRAGAAASAASAAHNEYKRAASAVSAAYSEYERAERAAYEEYKRAASAAFRVFAEQARPYLED